MSSSSSSSLTSDLTSELLVSGRACWELSSATEPGVGTLLSIPAATWDNLNELKWGKKISQHESFYQIKMIDDTTSKATKRADRKLALKQPRIQEGGGSHRCTRVLWLHGGGLLHLAGGFRWGLQGCQRLGGVGRSAHSCRGTREATWNVGWGGGGSYCGAGSGGLGWHLGLSGSMLLLLADVGWRGGAPVGLGGGSRGQLGAQCIQGEVWGLLLLEEGSTRLAWRSIYKVEHRRTDKRPQSRLLSSCSSQINPTWDTAAGGRVCPMPIFTFMAPPAPPGYWPCCRYWPWLAGWDTMLLAWLPIMLWFEGILDGDMPIWRVIKMTKTVKHWIFIYICFTRTESGQDDVNQLIKIKFKTARMGKKSKFFLSPF